MDNLSLTHEQLWSAWKNADEETQDLVEYALTEPAAQRIDSGSDDWELAAQLHNHQGILAIDRLVTEIGQQWADRMIKGMLNSRNLIDQREVDERRGWYTGARYALRMIPWRAHRRVMKARVENEEVES